MIQRAGLICGAVLLAALALSLGAGPVAAAGTEEAIRRCQQLVPGFETKPAGVRIELDHAGLDQPTGVRIDWRSMSRDRPDGWILCWFLPRESESEDWQISYLETSKYGRMSRHDVQQLYKLLYLMDRPLQEFPPRSSTTEAKLLYALQQTINGISLGCVYALIAVGFTMVYGVTRSINFAFGEIYMLGAFMMFIAASVLAWFGIEPATMALLFVLAGVAIIGGAYGWAMDRLVFRPIRQAPSTVPLIAAIGLAMALKEGVRLLQGPRTRFLLVSDLDTWPIVTGRGFDVYVSKGHLAVGLATAAITVLLWWISMRTRFGRSQRACAQDVGAAALLGVDVDRTIGLTFVLGSAIVASAGLFAGAQYGVITFHMGTLVGFKALTAALLGGIGSLPGAFLGGMLIALTESYATALIGSGWEDIAVFAVLVLVLLFRPAGLLGARLPSVAVERV